MNSSIDVYQNPKNKKEEIFISYPTYDQYVSREFADKEKVMKDREVASTRCPVCHMPAKRRIRWFMNNSRAYESVALCRGLGDVYKRQVYHFVRSMDISKERCESAIRTRMHIMQSRS